MVEVSTPKRIRVIGIDPGIQTGIAVYHREHKVIVKVLTLDFWGCYYFVKEFSPSDTLVVIEAPLKSTMYERQVVKAKKGSLARSNAMMAGPAGNAREAELLADGLEERGFEVRRVKPTRRNFKRAADDAAYVARVTGFAGLTNPHTRDAIMLCYGI